jgi:integrase
VCASSSPLQLTPVISAGAVGPGRHFFASVLLDAGESIKVVSEYLGHSDAGVTLRTYMHIMPNSTGRTKRAVDDALGCYISGTSEAL